VVAEGAAQQARDIAVIFDEGPADVEDDKPDCGTGVGGSAEHERRRGRSKHSLEGCPTGEFHGPSILQPPGPVVWRDVMAGS
jgi:hypothetical protein